MVHATNVQLEQILDVFDHQCWELLKSRESVPNLVTIGAQSSGKSSTLSEIALMPFPVSDDICTKFVTKLNLRRKAETSVAVNIIPDPDRAQKEREKLKRFVSPTLEPKALKSIVEAVCRRLGTDDDDGFCQDALNIRITSPEVPSITLVDLPGLVDVRISLGQTDQDVKFIQTIVQQYVDNPHTIKILVIEGSKEMASNKTLEYLKGDAAKRTIGVLTKPDLMQGQNTIKRYMDLVSNRNDLYHADLGWYILRNRAPEEADISQAERDYKESNLLAQPVFSSVAPEQKGAANLRIGVQTAVHKFYVEQLPLLRQDVHKELTAVEHELSNLPQHITTASVAREKLFPILHAVQKYVRSSFSLASKRIGLKPNQSASWLMDFSCVQQKLQALDRDMQIRLRGETGSPGAMEDVTMSEEKETESTAPQLSLSRAEQMIQSFPASFGEVSWGAAKALFLEQVEPWEHVIHRHVEQICSTVQLCLDEAFKKCALEEYFHKSLAELVLPHIIDAVRRELRAKLPSWCNVDHKHIVPEFEFSPTAQEAVKSAWLQEMDTSFVKMVFATHGVKPGPDGQLPKVNQSIQKPLDLQVMREKFISGVRPDRVNAKSVLLVVETQYEESFQQLVNGFSYSGYAKELLSCLSGVSTEMLASIGEPDLLKVFELPADLKLKVYELQNIREAAKQAISLLDSLIAG